MSNRWRGVRLVGVLVTSVVVMGLWTHAASSAPARGYGSGQHARFHTIRIAVRPVGPAGPVRQGYRVRSTYYEHTDCRKASRIVPGTNRCNIETGGTFYLDPCWPTSDSTGRYAGSYCLDQPWSHVGSLAKGKHRNSQPNPGQRAWALQIAGGKRCVAGASGSIRYHGKKLNYACGRGNRYLVGKPDHTTAVWHITSVKFSHHGLVDPQRVAITRAWVAVSSAGR